MTKLAAALPKHHGLHPLDGTLIEAPHQVHVVIAFVDCSRVTTDTDTDDVEPTARIRRIEAVLDGRDRDVARRLLERAAESRTGAAVLPLDLEVQLGADVSVDPRTGEVHDPT